MTAAAVQAPTVRERPILFSSSMIRAILAGRKTQTRRVVALPPWLNKLGGDLSKAWPDKAYGVTPCLKIPCTDGTVQRFRNPWGWPDVVPIRLWVRETWHPSVRIGADEVEIEYRADESSRTIHPPSAFMWEKWDDKWIHGPWRPSIFMPRWASRLTLEIVDVRVQRVQDISDEDARAEGVGDGCPACGSEDEKIRELCSGLTPCRCEFRSLWNSINGDRGYSWEKNCWCWCLSFRRLP